MKSLLLLFFLLVWSSSAALITYKFGGVGLALFLASTAIVLSHKNRS